MKENNTEIDNGNYEGKEYDNDGKIIFEGVFSNGQRLKGKKKVYDLNKNFLYDYEINSSFEDKEVIKEINITQDETTGFEKEIGKEKILKRIQYLWVNF